MVSSIWANNVPWQPKWPAVSWGSWVTVWLTGWIGVVSPRVLHVVLGCTIWEGYRNIRMCPEEGNSDGERTRGQDLWGAAKRTWLVQVRKEKTSLLSTTSSPGGAERQVLIFLLSRDSMQENGLKLHQGKFRLGIRKKLFPELGFKHWNNTPQGVVVAPSLSVFKKHLDNALRYTV